MLDYRQPGGGGGTQDGTHGLVAQDRFAIVAHRDSPGVAQGLVVCENLAHACDGGCANGIDACLCSALRRLHPLRDLGGVIDRKSVGHGGYAGEATGCCCRGAARDGLLVTLPGFAQVDVNINESGSNDEPGCIDDLHVLPIDFEIRFDYGDAAVLDEQIARRIDFGNRIDEMAALDQNPVRTSLAHADAASGIASSARAINAVRIATPCRTCSSM